MSTVVARLEAVLSANTRDFDRAMDRSEGRMHKVGRVAGVAGLAIAGGIAYGLEKSIKAAIDAQKVNARLAVSFQDAGLKIKAYGSQIDKLDASSRRLGFTDEQTKTSLGSLVTATGNMRKATKDLSVAQDIARFRGVGLTDATKMLTMAMTGSQRATKQLGINVSPVTVTLDNLKKSVEANITASHQGATAVQDHKAALDFFKTSLGITELAQAKLTDKQLTGDAVIKAVTAHVHGQADAYSKTAAGAMEQFKAQLNHIEVAIGEKLLPVITRSVQYVMAHWPQITAAIQTSWEAIKPTLKAFGDLIVSVVGLVRRHWSTIGPIVTQVVAVVKAQLAIISGVIKFFAAILRGDWSAAWNALKGIVRGVFNEIKAILTIQKDVLVAAMKAIGSAIASGFSAGLDLAWHFVTDKFHELIHHIPKLVRHLLGIASPSKVFEQIGVQVVMGMVRGLEKAGPELINKAKDLVHSIPGLGGGGSSLTPLDKHGNTIKGQLPGGLIQAANTIDSKHFPYVWGGGHSPATYGGPYDCSGAVSALLRAGGMLSGSEVSGQLMNFGEAGQGKALTILANPEHTYALINGHAWGTSGQNPGGGAGWFSGGIRPGYAIRHPKGFDSGGWLQPGLTLAMNNTGRPERVLGPGEGGGSVTQVFNFPNYVGSQNELAAAIQDVVVQYQDRNGRSMGGF